MAITTLELFACTGSQFPMQNICLLKDLEFIGINNVNVEVDFDILNCFSRLKEIDLKNLKHVKNVKSIFDNQSLRGISIFNCKNFPKESYERVTRNNYDFLQINP